MVCLEKADWDPVAYDAFAQARSRPARDLAAAIAYASPETVVDVGCGSGLSTAELRSRWPHATILGFDTSRAMVDTARARVPTAEFQVEDARAWTPHRPVDVIFSNAVLHWIPDVEPTLHRLVAPLEPGGVLAFQVPDNADEPSHAAMRDMATDARWAGQLAAAVNQRGRSLRLESWYDLLRRVAPNSEIDLWRTTYAVVLANVGEIVAWFRSTGLKPYLDRLDKAGKASFEAEYLRRLSDAYTTQADGRVILRFPRLFATLRIAPLPSR